MSNLFNDPSEDSNDGKFDERLRTSLERSEFNYQLRGAQTAPFRKAFEMGLIHDTMLSDALGHPVAFRALERFLENARPGSFDPADAESDDWPQISAQGRAEQERYNLLFVELFHEYAALDPKERVQSFGGHPADCEPDLSALSEQLKTGSLSVAELLNILISD